MRNTPLRAFAKSALKQKKETIYKGNLPINPNTKISQSIKDAVNNPGTISQGKEIKGKFDKITVDKDKLTNILTKDIRTWENPFGTKRKKTKFQ